MSGWVSQTPSSCMSEIPCGGFGIKWGSCHSDLRKLATQLPLRKCQNSKSQLFRCFLAAATVEKFQPLSKEPWFLPQTPAWSFCAFWHDASKSTTQLKSHLWTSIIDWTFGMCVGSCHLVGSMSLWSYHALPFKECTRISTKHNCTWQSIRRWISTIPFAKLARLRQEKQSISGAGLCFNIFEFKKVGYIQYEAITKIFWLDGNAYVHWESVQHNTSINSFKLLKF